MVESHVWFSGNKLCAVMPALILFDTVFEPMWRIKGAEISESSEYTYVCINAPRSGTAIVRSGRGFGRHGREKYYWVDFSTRTVKRVKHRPTKKLYGGWMVCIDTPSGNKLCFEWRDNRLVTANLPV